MGIELAWVEDAGREGGLVEEVRPVLGLQAQPTLLGIVHSLLPDIRIDAQHIRKELLANCLRFHDGFSLHSLGQNGIRIQFWNHKSIADFLRYSAP